MRLALMSALLCLTTVVIVPSAHAGDVVTPAGFNVETRAHGGQPVLQMNDGSFLMKFGGFGPNVFRKLHTDGTSTLFADGIGSFAGAAQSPVTGDVFIGDFNTGGVWHFHDANNDGDVLDVGETDSLSASLAVLPGGGTVSSYALAFRPGTDDMYMNGTGSDFLAYVVRISDASSPAGTATIFADGLTIPGGLAFQGDVLFAGDFAFAGSRVLRLEDGNADGDALDLDEAGDYVSGLPGANLLAFDAAGNLYVSGVSDFVTVSAISKCGPDGDNDGVSDSLELTWLNGVGFTGGMLVLEGAGGLVGGVDGDGLLWIEDSNVLNGSLLLRSAPFATVSVVGVVANNSNFDVVVSGAAPGMAASFGLLALSLDTAGTTVEGIGDLCLGFGAPHLITTALPLVGPGEAVWSFSFHGLDALVGLDLAIQGFVSVGGDVGISNGLVIEVGA